MYALFVKIWLNKSVSLDFIWYRPIIHVLGHTNPKLQVSVNAILVNLLKKNQWTEKKTIKSRNFK